MLEKINNDFRSRLNAEASAKSGGVTHVSMENIDLRVTAESTIKEFCHAFVEEGYRKANLLANRINLQEDDLFEYFQFLLDIRVKIVNNQFRDRSLLNLLAMPCFIELVLTGIGKVIVRDKGYTLVPNYSVVKEFDKAKMIEISEKIKEFGDYLSIVEGGMPRNEQGDRDIMSMALVDNYIRSIDRVDNPVAEYVVYFLQMKLENTVFDKLYRFEYDNTADIDSQIKTMMKVLLGVNNHADGASIGQFPDNNKTEAPVSKDKQ